MFGPTSWDVPSIVLFKSQILKFHAGETFSTRSLKWNGSRRFLQFLLQSVLTKASRHWKQTLSERTGLKPLIHIIQLRHETIRWGRIGQNKICLPLQIFCFLSFQKFESAGPALACDVSFDRRMSLDWFLLRSNNGRSIDDSAQKSGSLWKANYFFDCHYVGLLLHWGILEVDDLAIDIV